MFCSGGYRHSLFYANSNTHILEGNVATRCRCCGIFNSYFVANRPECVSEIVLKVGHRRSYSTRGGSEQACGLVKHLKITFNVATGHPSQRWSTLITYLFCGAQTQDAGAYQWVGSGCGTSERQGGKAGEGQEPNDNGDKGHQHSTRRSKRVNLLCVDVTRATIATQRPMHRPSC